jgi:hypothetical protein
MKPIRTTLPAALKCCCLSLLALLAVGACTESKKKETVVVIDSSYVTAFKRNQLRMKYMSDDGEPHVIDIGSIFDKIVIPVHRQHIELAFQNNNTITQYFAIRRGDSILLTEWQDNIGIKILNRQSLPFDENYKTLYRATLPENALGVDDFYRATLLLNDTRSFDWSKDAEFIEELTDIKNKALRAVPLENKFLDSLTQHTLISPEVAAFYKLKNNFDSIKISLYQGGTPRITPNTLLAPLSPLSLRTAGGDSAWMHFTFYDDWLDIYLKQLALTTPAGRSLESSPDSLHTLVQNLNIPDARIKHTLLQKARNVTPNISTNAIP